MPAVWPATLPQIPLVEGYLERFGPNTIRTPMDWGPAKRRRRFTKSHDPHQFAFEVDGTQLATFKAFYKTTILHGALSFDYTHPTDGVTATFAMLDEPNIVPVGGNYYRVSFSAERTA